MRFTKNTLKNILQEENERLCKNKSVELALSGAYGGWQIVLRSKYDNENKTYLNKYLMSGETTITYGFLSSREAYYKYLEELRVGNVAYIIDRIENINNN